MERMTLFLRSLALLLSLGLALPAAPAFALRNLGAQENPALLQAIQAGLEEDVDEEKVVAENVTKILSEEFLTGALQESSGGYKDGYVIVNGVIGPDGRIMVVGTWRDLPPDIQGRVLLRSGELRLYQFMISTKVDPRVKGPDYEEPVPQYQGGIEVPVRQKLVRILRRTAQEANQRKAKGSTSPKPSDATGLEERAVAERATPRQIGASRFAEAATTFEWGRKWAGWLSRLEGKAWDGLNNAIHPTELAPWSLVPHLEANGRALVVPVFNSSEAMVTGTVTLWVHSGMDMPAWMRLGSRVKIRMLSPQIAEAEKELKGANPTDLVFLSANVVSKERLGVWANLLDRYHLVGFRMLPQSLEEMSQADFATLMAILEVSGDALYDYDIVDLLFVDVEGKRNLLFNL